MQQPQFYQTNTEIMIILKKNSNSSGMSFKSITDNWKKLDQEKLFLKTRKKDGFLNTIKGYRKMD